MLFKFYRFFLNVFILLEKIKHFVVFEQHLKLRRERRRSENI